MDAEKFSKIQVQMKQNQQDYGDFLKDLDKWGDEMKKKESDLKNVGSTKKVSCSTRTKCHEISNKT